MSLITPYEIKNAGLPVSSHLDDRKIEICIKEAEMRYVREKITDSLYIDLIKWTQTLDKSAFPEEYITLMNGGIFQSKSCCGDLEERVFEGLIRATIYYTYARIVRTNDNQVTRFGFVNKNDEYSDRVDLKEKLAAEKDSLALADMHISDCVLYIESNKEKFPLYKRAGRAKNRISFNVIDSYHGRNRK